MPKLRPEDKKFIENNANKKAYLIFKELKKRSSPIKSTWTVILFMKKLNCYQPNKYIRKNGGKKIKGRMPFDWV